jgi:hypothetical protein
LKDNGERIRVKEIEHFKYRISDAEIEKRIKAWADVTMLSLEMKRAVIRQKHPELGEDEISGLVRKELSMLRASNDE